jgi:hypothetical protein
MSVTTKKYIRSGILTESQIQIETLYLKGCGVFLKSISKEFLAGTKEFIGIIKAITESEQILF